MTELSRYKLHFLQGTEEFVLKELLEKFPGTEIESKEKKEYSSQVRKRI